MTRAPHRINLGLPSGPPKFRSRLEHKLRFDQISILGLDPGGTTGWSLLVIPKEIDGTDVFSHKLDKILENIVNWDHGEIVTLGAEDESAYRLSSLIMQRPGIAVVVEDFILRAERKEKSRELLSPVRITAKLESYLWRMQCKMFLQQPAQAKTTVTDERLRLWGCIPPDGLTDHARDADRHVILFLRRCLGAAGAQLKVSAWPHIYAACENKDETLGA